MLAGCTARRRLRAAVAGGGDESPTGRPRHRQRAPRNSSLELKDAAGARRGTARVPAPPISASWRDQLHAALVGLGYAAREADDAVAAVAPKPKPPPPRCRPCSSAPALRTLSRR
ncbi:hypothetical protein ACU686_04940 [Yinghuangia aomiensis]